MITNLRLHECKALTCKSIDLAVSALSDQLIKLDVGGISESALSHPSGMSLAKSSHNLLALSVSNCKQLDVVFFATLVIHAKQLTVLCMESSYQDDLVFALLVPLLPQLGVLTFGGPNKKRGQNISDAALEIIATHCLSLHTLHIFDCLGLTDGGANMLFNNLKCKTSLTDLSFHRCYMMTPFIVSYIVTNCPNVSRLDLTWSLFVNTSPLNLPAVLPHLTVLKVEKVWIASEWLMKVSSQLQGNRRKGVVQLSQMNVLNVLIVVLSVAVLVMVLCWCVLGYFMYSLGLFAPLHSAACALSEYVGNIVREVVGRVFVLKSVQGVVEQNL
eukprot:gene21926-28006_t